VLAVPVKDRYGAERSKKEEFALCEPIKTPQAPAQRAGRGNSEFELLSRIANEQNLGILWAVCMARSPKNRRVGFGYPVAKQSPTFGDLLALLAQLP
jgi:hypothetical protein